MKQTTKTLKRICALALSLILVFSLTGCCGEQLTTTLNADGTSTLTFKYLYEKSFYDSLMNDNSISNSDTAIKSGDFTETVETIGKYSYYGFSRNFSFSSYEELKNFLSDVTAFKNAMKQGSKNPSSYDSLSSSLFSDVTVNTNLFKGTLSQESISNGLWAAGKTDTSEDLSTIQNYNEYYQNEVGIRIDFSITFPSAPTASNGTISGNTVTWNLADISASGVLIAEVGGNLISSDTTSPVIKGVKNGAIYKKIKTATATDNLCLQSFTANGQNQGSTEIVLGLKDGKYKLVAKDCAGNTTICTVTIDLTKPTIKGAKYGKTYKKKVTLKFKDKFGIKKITVNGKKIKNCKSKKFSKAGSYTVKVTDRAGNTATMKFKIKK